MTVDVHAPAPLGERLAGGRASRVGELLSNKVTATGMLLIFLLVAVAGAAPWLARYDPFDQDVFSADAAPSLQHWFGTDQFGRDVLARVIYGTRVSLLLGIAGPLLAGLIGTLVGTVAGYVGGWIDRISTRVSDLFMSFPTLLLGVLIAAALGPGLRNVLIAISVALFPRFVRLARASTLSIRNEPYIEASVAAGQSPMRIIWMHILPNISGPIVVMSTLWIATAIRLEASLSFLGLGAQPPSPSWGNMVREGMNNLLGSPWPIVFAGLAITISVLAFNMVGDALRDALDPETAPR